MTPLRKLLATAVTALVTSTTFLTWLAGQGNLDWRGWTAIIFTAVAPVAVQVLTPNTATAYPWWPLRSVAAAAVTALAASTGFLVWLAGTGVFTLREAVALVVTAALPVVMGYLTPAGGPPPGGATAVDGTQIA